MKSPQKKFNSHVGLSFVHLIVVVLILVALSNEPHQWLALGLLASLLVWPLRFWHHLYSKRVIAQQTRVGGS
jgi:hypothetical protein